MVKLLLFFGKISLTLKKLLTFITIITIQAVGLLFFVDSPEETPRGMANQIMVTNKSNALIARSEIYVVFSLYSLTEN
jgi:hypothetical protein